MSEQGPFSNILKNSSKKISRNADGLIEGIEYIYNENGLINWRKMVKPEYLVPNKEKTSETDISKLEDKDLLILLGGTKELASIRGFSSVEYSVVCPHPEYVVASCKINWIPNYETEGNAISFSAIGDASPYNTKSFAKNFLGPTAENRAFVRCVRNFLKINIVGQDEIGKPDKEQATEESNDSSPTSILSKIMKEKKIPFKKIKDKLVEEKFDKADSIESVEDIPKIKIFELIERIKSAKIKD